MPEVPQPSRLAERQTAADAATDTVLQLPPEDRSVAEESRDDGTLPQGSMLEVPFAARQRLPQIVAGQPQRQ